VTGSNGQPLPYQIVQTAGPTVILGPSGDEISGGAAAEVGVSVPASLAQLSITDAGGGSAGGSGAGAGGCSAKILGAVNGQFGTSFTTTDVKSEFQYSSGAAAGTGTLNLNVSGGGVSVGRYPVNWWTYIIGYGPTLHIPAGPGGFGGLDSSLTLPFSSSQFTAHLDSALAYNPFGALFHLLIDVKGVGGYKPCP
jgi:hypothetical protein